MNVFHIDYHHLKYWSHTDLSFIQRHADLKPFLAYAPELDSFSEAIRERQEYPVDRDLLWRVLHKQYQALGHKLPVEKEVLLDHHTFTVTTAHQPALLTGPLYHIYKIASTIHLARTLQNQHPDHTFIPVFVVSGEDHDWEEINHLHLFGKKYQWERSASGPCGRLTTDGLEAFTDQIVEVLSNTPHAGDLKLLFTTALSSATTYGEFQQSILCQLFGDQGLVVLNMDDAALKKAFIPIMEKELLEQFSLQHVLPTQQALEEAGFKPQAYCRPINLFYMSPDRRERIEPVSEGFQLVESLEVKTKEDLLEELHHHPERFSPNVILRPLYQELILPNLAYVGGGGEIAYWLERKSQFAYASIHFPVLIRRNSMMIIDRATAGQLARMDLQWEDLLEDYEVMVKSYLRRHSQTELGFDSETALLKKAYNRLAEKAEKLDPTLAKAILAEETKQIKQFEQLGSRLMRAEKQLHETHLKRIQKLRDRLFPDNGLQERHENFLSFYSQGGADWLNQITELCDPLIARFTVVVQQE